MLALERAPDVTERGDVLLDALPRLVVGHGEARLDVRPYLRAEAEVEPATRRALDGPRVHRGDHRASREGDRDAGAEAQARRRGRRDGKREERIDLRLGDPQPVIAVALAARGILAR